jgi:hypothetical protein
MPPEILEECFRAEQRDEVWAPAIETRLREFIARQPYGNTFHVASVECHATLCEIHASTDTPVELTDPQGPMSPATWQSLILNVHQDGKLASEFEDAGLLPAARYGERADYMTTLVRRSSAAAHDEARCGGNDLEALRSRALKFVTGDVAQGLPPLSEEIMVSAFKLGAYFEAEERDETWAAAMEASIREALAAQPSTRAWEETSIECQTTLCQVRALTDQATADDFRKVIARITSESSNLGMTRVANGVTKNSQDPTQVVHIATLFRTR